MNRNFVNINISNPAHYLIGIQFDVYVVDDKTYFGHITAISGLAVMRFNDSAYNFVELEFPKRLFLFQLNFDYESLFYT
jgi:hypothetical protein